MDAKLNLDKLVESTEGNGKSNYVAWRFKLNLLLRMKGLFEIVTGETPQPTATDEGYAAWVKKDIEAQTIIGLNVDENIALKITHCSTSANMIERLETLHGKKSQKSIDMLQQQFFAYKYDETKTAVENCLIIDGLAQELKTNGEDVKDSWLMSRILNCLPAKFDHFHAAWQSVAEIDKTLINLRNRLQQEEIRLLGRESEIASNALIGKLNKFGKNQEKKNYTREKDQEDSSQNNSLSQLKIKCHKCGESGHFKRNCRNKPCQEYLDYCKRNYDCHNCHEKGHFSNECPKKSSNEGDRAKSFVSVALSSSILKGLANHHDLWIKDSGATHHLTGNLKWLSHIRSLGTPIPVEIGDSTKLEGTALGDVYLNAYNGEKWCKIVLKDVLFVPELSFNLFSVTTALDKGYTQSATAEESVIMEQGKPVLIAKRTGGLFYMMFREMEEYSLPVVSLKLWHERLAHQNVRHVKDILKKNKIKYIDDWEDHICKGCVYGKQHKVSHPTNNIVAKNPLDRVHVDLGEMNVRSLGGAKYFLLFKDDYSHFRTIFFWNISQRQ